MQDELHETALAEVSTACDEAFHAYDSGSGTVLQNIARVVDRYSNRAAPSNRPS